MNEIPRERWMEYLNALGNRRVNQPVRMRIEGGEQGQKDMADMPLLGISCEEKGSEANAIEITLADVNKNMENITHMVEEPERILVDDTSGNPHRLDIESRGKIKTILFFQEAGETAKR